MPLNISIDVDDTLLDRDGQLVPDAVDGLKKLKAAGHTLQLWSAGGAEYAQQKSAKHGIAGFFTSFASKPDVAIDDLPVMFMSCCSTPPSASSEKCARKIRSAIPKSHVFTSA